MRGAADHGKNGGDSGLANSFRLDDLMNMTKTTPQTIMNKGVNGANSKADSAVLGVTGDGVRILRQRPGPNFTQKEAAAAVRKVVAARLAG